MTDRSDIVRALVPLPPPDPRRRRYEGQLERDMGNPELDRLLMGGRQLNKYTPRVTYPSDPLPDDDFGSVLRGVTSRVDPERFGQALQQFPTSQNIVHGPPLSAADDMHIMLDNIRRTSQGRPPLSEIMSQPDAPGWEYLSRKSYYNEPQGFGP